MKKQEKQRRFCNLMISDSGLTLIDTVIALVLVGLLMIPIVHGLKLLKNQSASYTNDQNFYTASQALENFYSINGYYPCPADPQLGPDDEQYGEPLTLTGGTDCVIPPGSNGLVVEGAFPFKALKMTAKEALDGWGNKITYAVTTSLTKASTFNEFEGKVEIQDNLASCDLSGTPITGTDYHFVFLSHGQNAAGAYNTEGRLVEKCKPDAGDPPVESENCNKDQTFIFDMCMKNNVPGLNYYDDEFYINAGNYWRLPSKMWAKGEDQNDAGSRGVFVGVNNFEAAHPLDVKGNVMVQRFGTDPEKTGQAHATEFCTETQNNGIKCTNASVIAGSDPRMRCDGSGQGVGGIGNNSTKCSNSTTAIRPTTCEIGQFVVGISDDGEFICGGPQ